MTAWDLVVPARVTVAPARAAEVPAVRVHEVAVPARGWVRVAPARVTVWAAGRFGVVRPFPAGQR
ncbi:hypothetical protein [Actinoplanes sp. G11-F43]|uniref:hypothetical protein n=1 Tax=Actinoplanes sp. G11-F43 TaxID=3424130 RepID=UPI003D327E60